LDAWVEKGQAPTEIIATSVTAGRVNRSRPLCPYPQVASYKGTGSTDDAANFVCKVP
jgi:feruloyl esterase